MQLYYFYPFVSYIQFHTLNHTNLNLCPHCLLSYWVPLILLLSSQLYDCALGHIILIRRKRFPKTNSFLPSSYPFSVFPLLEKGVLATFHTCWNDVKPLCVHMYKCPFMSKKQWFLKLSTIVDPYTPFSSSSTINSED